MATQQDEEFGTLTEAVGGWQLEPRVLFAGQEVPIVIEPAEDGSFDAMQRTAVRFALALGPDAHEEAAPAVVQNYEVYRDMIGDDEQVPPLAHPTDVWQQVRIERITVPQHYEARHAYFLMEAECGWDEEHGLEVRFRDGAAIEADQAGSTGGASDDTEEQLEAVRQLIAEANAQFDS